MVVQEVTEDLLRTCSARPDATAPGILARHALQETSAPIPISAVCRRSPRSLSICATRASNFVGKDLYGTLDCSWLHRLAAEGFALRGGGIWRPRRRKAIACWCWCVTSRTACRSCCGTTSMGPACAPVPRRRSGPGVHHSFGMALDVTLLDPQGRELDMGSGYDEMSEVSHPRLEAAHLEAAC